MAEMHKQCIPSNELIENSEHHKIYLSNPRRVALRMKPVLKQPACVGTAHLYLAVQLGAIEEEEVAYDVHCQEGFSVSFIFIGAYAVAPFVLGAIQG